MSVTADAVDEPDETFSVTLTNPIGNAVISPTAGSATVTIVDDQPPVAAADGYIVRVDRTLTVDAPGVLANDTAPPGVTLTAIKVTDPISGALTLNPDGSFSYVPVSISVQTFSYKANDGRLDSNVATVTIDVTPGNRPPIASDDFHAVTPGQVLTVPALGVLANDTDPDGDPLTAVLVTDIPAAEGAVALGTDGFFIYDPAAFVGVTTFTYQAKDPDGALSTTATVTLAVGVPVLSIADVSVNEAGLVGVDYATADVTATAPGDLRQLAARCSLARVSPPRPYRSPSSMTALTSQARPLPYLSSTRWATQWSIRLPAARLSPSWTPHGSRRASTPRPMSSSATLRGRSRSHGRQWTKKMATWSGR